MQRESVTQNQGAPRALGNPTCAVQTRRAPTHFVSLFLECTTVSPERLRWSCVRLSIRGISQFLKGEPCRAGRITKRTHLFSQNRNSTLPSGRQPPTSLPSFHSTTPSTRGQTAVDVFYEHFQHLGEGKTHFAHWLLPSDPSTCQTRMTRCHS